VVGGFEQVGWQGENEVRDAGFIPEVNMLENGIYITVRAKFQTYRRSLMALDARGR
jgi:hypothetical protein